MFVSLVDKLEREHVLTRDEFAALLAALASEGLEGETGRRLAARALAVRLENFGRDVYLRGLIEFTSYCKNDCLYCGLRRGNGKAERYRLTADEIFERCRVGYDLDFRTFVLQGGEDPYFTDARMLEIISGLRQRFPDCAITLSVGEKSRETYQKYFAAGADRFLLRHETATPEHYAQLHPADMSLRNRQECLRILKDIGFQVGAGFMVGSPFQTFGNIADDLLFISALQPQMVGIGPFIPHPETPLGGYEHGSAAMTVAILGILRLMLPKSLLPATTALGTIDPHSREKALAFGANVMMPNLSPLSVRKKYDIYTGKIHLDEEAAEGVGRLKARLHELGYKTPLSRGDFSG